MSRITPILLVVACYPAAPLLAGPELKKSEVRSVVMETMPDIRRCGSKDETVNVRFRIEGDGRVTRIAIEGDHKSDPVGKCMKKHIAAMRFGHSIKSTPVTFPFTLGNAAPATHLAAKGSGRLTRKDLDGLLEILESDLKKCGDGVANTTFTIKPTGKVGNVKVDDVDEKTGDCVTRKVSSVRFPAPKKPTAVARAFSLEES